MCKRWRRTTVGCLAVLVAATAAAAQVFEDRMEPAQLGILQVDTLRIPGSAYVGQDSCRSCHPSAYRAWLGSSHARSAVGLTSDTAMEVAGREGMTGGDPVRSGLCLSCHGVAHDVPAAYRGPGVRMAEGVTCEACHGPQGRHVALVEGRVGRYLSIAKTAASRAYRFARIRFGGKAAYAEARCMGCHKPRESHAKDGAIPAFAFDVFWKKIQHGPEE